jgi:hypothetical protein
LGEDEWKVDHAARLALLRHPIGAVQHAVVWPEDGAACPYPIAAQRARDRAVLACSAGRRRRPGLSVNIKRLAETDKLNSVIRSALRLGSKAVR